MKHFSPQKLGRGDFTFLVVVVLLLYGWLADFFHPLSDFFGGKNENSR